MLQALPAEELRDLMSQMFEVEAQPDQVLIAEGDVDADNFYIVQGGKYEVTLLRRPGEVVHTYRNPGESFGELALLYNCPRAATVRCTRGGTLWALDRATFRAVLCGSKALTLTLTRTRTLTRTLALALILALALALRLA